MTEITPHILLNPCNYSFIDLLTGANEDIDTKTLYALPQKELNEKVKELCKKAQWYWQDVTGSDGIIYTAFSPKISEK